jgi:hypothetical protein
MHQPGVGATTKDTRVLALRDQSHTLASWWQQRRAPVMTDPATSLSVTMGLRLAFATRQPRRPYLRASGRAEPSLALGAHQQTASLFALLKRA